MKKSELFEGKNSSLRKTYDKAVKLPSRPKSKLEEFEELAHAYFETHQGYWDAIELAKDYFGKK